MSLIHGWVPVTVQVITAVAAIGWRSRRWRMIAVPVALFIGVALTVAVFWFIEDQGVADDPAPLGLWVWITLTGLAAVVVVLGWRDVPWWRRGVSVVAVPLCVLCTALTVNMWVAYFPTVGIAWDRMTGSPLPGQTDRATVAALQQQHRATRRTIVSVRIPDHASGFKHRDELVLLPPHHMPGAPPPPLPVVMIVGGEFGNPAAWLYAGDAQSTIADFAAGFGGNAPVLVFPDSSGTFSNDTECVNGVRGNAADHLTKDVVPYVIPSSGSAGTQANWGIVGWSAGGTCALTLSVMHPELFGAFVDIDGQLGPTAGTKQQTIARLFGGDADAWAAFDPPDGDRQTWCIQRTVGLVRGSGRHSYGVPRADRRRSASRRWHGSEPRGPCRHRQSSVPIGQQYGIECSVVPNPGKHDFSSAASAFAAALPWLAGKLGTPGVPPIAMPGAPPPR